MKERGRRFLAGNWTMTALLTLTLYLATAIPTIIFETLFDSTSIAPMLLLFYLLIVTGPLNFGYTYCLRKLSKKETISIPNLFVGFERLGKLIWLTVVIGFFVFLWTLLFIIPGIIAAIRYSQAYPILVDNPDLSVMEAINESKRLMWGNKGKFFLLVLSFIWWILLARIPAGIAAIIMKPYYEAVTGQIPQTVPIPGGIIYYSDIPLTGFAYWLEHALDCVSYIGYLWLMPYMTISLIVFYRNLIGEDRFTWDTVPNVSHPAGNSDYNGGNVNYIGGNSPYNDAGQSEYDSEYDSIYGVPPAGQPSSAAESPQNTNVENTPPGGSQNDGDNAPPREPKATGDDNIPSQDLTGRKE